MKEQARINWYLLFLIIAGAFIRFYNLGNLSLSNDELSALSRALLPNLHELIWNGVHLDTHLIGTHFLLFSIVHLLGDDVFFIRLPFAIMGVASIYLIYLVAQKWFNPTVGLLSATAVCFLEFTVLYSQIARPYMFGFFFVLLFLHGLNYFIFSEKLKWYHFVIFITGALGAVLNHYFSFLTVFIAGLFAFALIKKIHLKAYLISGIVVLILFLPHLSISLDQISRKGLDSWLEKPDNIYFFRFLFYVFNESWLLVLSIIILFISHFFIQSSVKLNFSTVLKFRLYSFTIFLFVFLIGYFYSRYVSPVLQFSVLIFVLPFLLILIFSFFATISSLYKWPLVLVLASLFSASTFIEKRYYKTNHFGVFKEIAEQSIFFNTKLGSNNITQTINIVNPFYIQYYFDKMNSDLKFLEYEFKNDGSGYRKMDSIVSNAKTPFFIHAWTNVYDPYELHELIQRKYPKFYEIKFFNSNFRVYYKGRKSERKNLFSSINSFDAPSNFWYGNENTIQLDDKDSLNKICALTPNFPYSPNFIAKVKDVFIQDSKHVVVKAKYYFEKNASLNLVIDFIRDGQSYEWYGPSIHEFTNERNNWKEIIIVKKLPINAMPEDDIKIYFWNSGNVPVKIDSVSINVYEGINYSW